MFIKESLIIEPLTKRQPRSEFSCGVPELDRYIKELANQDIKRHTARIFGALVNKRIVGFYTLSATTISHEAMPTQMIRKLPKYPVPAALMGRLAVDQSFHGMKIGKILLVNAMKRVLFASASIGIHALVVDAKGETAKSFYQHFGFIELQNQPLRLFLPMNVIAELGV